METPVELPPLETATILGLEFIITTADHRLLSKSQALEIIRRSNQHEADQKRIGEAVEALEAISINKTLWECHKCYWFGKDSEIITVEGEGEYPHESEHGYCPKCKSEYDLEEMHVSDYAKAILTKLKGER
jgi:hypothetical protein